MGLIPAVVLLTIAEMLAENATAVATLHGIGPAAFGHER